MVYMAVETEKQRPNSPHQVKTEHILAYLEGYNAGA
jgi:hypothetical protein